MKNIEQLFYGVWLAIVVAVPSVVALEKMARLEFMGAKVRLVDADWRQQQIRRLK